MFRQIVHLSRQHLIHHLKTCCRFLFSVMWMIFAMVETGMYTYKGTGGAGCRSLQLLQLTVTCIHICIYKVVTDVHTWKQVMQIVDGRRLQLLQLMIEQGRRPLSDNVDNMYEICTICKICMKQVVTGEQHWSKRCSADCRRLQLLQLITVFGRRPNQRLSCKKKSIHQSNCH